MSGSEFAVHAVVYGMSDASLCRLNFSPKAHLRVLVGKLFVSLSVFLVFAGRGNR